MATRLEKATDVFLIVGVVFALLGVAELALVLLGVCPIPVIIGTVIVALASAMAGDLCIIIDMMRDS